MIAYQVLSPAGGATGYPTTVSAFGIKLVARERKLTSVAVPKHTNLLYWRTVRYRYVCDIPLFVGIFDPRKSRMICQFPIADGLRQITNKISTPIAGSSDIRTLLCQTILSEQVLRIQLPAPGMRLPGRSYETRSVPLQSILAIWSLQSVSHQTLRRERISST